MFGLDFNQTVAWIVAGLPFDLLHSIGNIALGTIILPLSLLLTRLTKGWYKKAEPGMLKTEEKANVDCEREGNSEQP